MQENNAVMLHVYPLASLKLEVIKSVCHRFLEVSPAPASASTAFKCAIDGNTITVMVRDSEVLNHSRKE